VGTISPLDLRDYWTKVHRTSFTQRGRNRCTKPHSPISYIFICSRDIRRRTLKSTKMGPNFACFWPLKFFLAAPPKFLTDIIKLNTAPSIVQNFAAIGPWSSEITRGGKMNASKT